MNKITSFTVNHENIIEGIYLSRIDEDVATFDLRTRKPNSGDYMDNITMHSLEHMFATYIRNSEISNDVIYFGPMGCQTGFYLLIRNANSKIADIVMEILQKIINHQGEIFGNTAKECGNYKNLSLRSAVEESRRYLEILKKKEFKNFKSIDEYKYY